MMRRQLDDVREAGNEAVAALWAAEAAIYGRFGYGLAAAVRRAQLRDREARLRADVPRRSAPGCAAPADAVDAMRADLRRRRAPPGPACSTARASGGTCGSTIRRPTARAPARCRAAVIDGDRVRAVRRQDPVRGEPPAGEVQVRELMAATPEALRGALGLPAQPRPDAHALPVRTRPTTTRSCTCSPRPTRCTVRLHEALWVRLVDLPARAARAHLRASRSRSCSRSRTRSARGTPAAGRCADGSTATCAKAAVPRARARHRARRRLPRRHAR